MTESNTNPTSQAMTLDSREEATMLFGPRDQYLRTLREALNVKILARGDMLQLDGSEEDIDRAKRTIDQLLFIARKQGRLTPEDVRTVLHVVQEGGPNDGKNVTFLDTGKYVRPRTDGQGLYVQALQNHDVVICVGPAGTGKTYLAVGWAVTLLRMKKIKKIVLVRPAVEAGERLGYLPGDLVAKINPYLRPLFDSLNDMMDVETVQKYMERDVIEILPLAYMRGRTLNNACIILDEGQNASITQMKMFLTRMGHDSKIIVTGDMTQVDLPRTIKSGLIDAVNRLRNIPGIALVHLQGSDIVRNPLVQKIVNAYENEHPNSQKKIT